MTIAVIDRVRSNTSDLSVRRSDDKSTNSRPVFDNQHHLAAVDPVFFTKLDMMAALFSPAP